MPLDQGSKAKLIKQVQKAIKGQESGELIKGSDQAVRRGPLASRRRTRNGVVATRYGAALEAAAAAEQNIQPPPAEMALVADDSGIGSLHAHNEMEPTHTIAANPGMRTIAIKSGVLAVLSHFYSLSKECPYAFLEEFCRYCDIQPVPAGSTSEDYRLKAIPFILKADAGVWLSRLLEGSIRTWVEFRMIFLDHFFPASKTSALKNEITEARQEYDEPLGHALANLRELGRLLQRISGSIRSTNRSDSRSPSGKISSSPSSRAGHLA
ncbi:hypothetical protein SASPL_118126 [Salvia splendens]|uniref:Retrotransposon gag domain-containing protein n=1 Tax=Salvia splendens TaxID=180675 RepID=A0A8X8XZ49_SALSN|nr:hypothetical protein SASPL_118126 [Salvia splendens]